jgi:NAD(P)-dependent dehydrogenase (short-subunit alcohol dehydrogenase family)
MRPPGTEGMGEGLDQLAAPLPARRAALPSEIAAAAVYLASDEAIFVYGAAFSVDGGRIAVSMHCPLCMVSEGKHAW